MNRLAFFLSLFVVSVCSITYDVEQVRILLHRTIDCLQKYKVLSRNATFQTMVAYGYSDIDAYIPNLNDDTRKDIKVIQHRLKRLLHSSYHHHHDDISKELYKSLYWFGLADLSMNVGQIKKLPPLGKSFLEILEDTIPTPEIEKCNADVLLYNPPSDGLRNCKLNCLEEMTHRNYHTKFPPEAKMCYIGLAMVSNCSNLSPQQYRELATHFCSYTKIEIEKMLYHKHHKIFADSYFYFLKKVGFCASWGVAEVLTPKIITAILNRIDCHGCVGTDSGDKETIQVLTADTAFVLVALYRFILESNEVTFVPNRLIG